MKLLKRSITSGFCLLVLFVGLVKADKSVFIISKHSSPSRAQAYRIDGDQINYQAQVDIDTYNQGYGAVGNAVWSEKELMFVTYENSPMVVWASTKTLQKVGEFNTGISSCAGIAIDEYKGKIYIVRRNYEDLYVYSFDNVNNTLILDGQYDLETFTGYIDALGISLDQYNDLLYVSNGTNTVHYYDTNDWDLQGSIDIVVNAIGRNATGIAVDAIRGYLYSGDWEDHNYLVRTLTSSPYTSTQVEIIKTGYPSEELIGVDVDEDTGLVHCTTYHHDFRVYGSNLALKDTETNGISGPAGVAVGGLYKPPRFYLKKVDVNEPNSVLPGDYITYEITYGPNGVNHNNVVITDYLPRAVNYPNPLDQNYDPNNHTYKWIIGNLPAGTPNNTVILTVQVNERAEPLGKIRNYCEIENEQYCSFAAEDTNVSCWGGEIIYVDESAATGSNSGTSWANAYLDLQDALARARSGCGSKIWVTAGTYKPTNGSTRSISFEMIEGVDIYGGFPPGGGPRNPRIYQTILSGDIDDNGNPSNNSYHVVRCANIDNAILDGFTITGGNADSDPDYRGGGIYIYNNSSPTIKNCIFNNNSAGTGGGGMYNYNSSNPNITNCIFYGNQTTEYEGHGGGIYNYNSSPTITNCTLSSNSALQGYGGGMFSDSSTNPTVTNCIFWGNDASYCNEIYPPAPYQIVSYCDIQGGWPGQTNINKDPCFVNDDANNYHLAANSLCIDKGNNSAVPPSVSTDIDGEPRKVDGDGNGSSIVDIGADEYYWSPADFDKDEKVNFIDYVMFANAWRSNNHAFNLAGDNYIDYNDLKLFCDDWLWQAGQPKTLDYGMGAMESGIGELLELAGEGFIPESNQEITVQAQTDGLLYDTGGLIELAGEGFIPEPNQEITVQIQTDIPLFCMATVVNVNGDANIISAMNPADCDQYGWDIDWPMDPYIDDVNNIVYFGGVSWVGEANGIVGYLKFRYNSGQVTVSIIDGFAADANCQLVEFSDKMLIFGEPDPNE